jgi:L-fucose isomerase-like protein
MKVKIGFVPCHRLRFSEEWAVNMRRRVLSSLESLPEREKVEVVVPDDSVTRNGLVRNDADAEKVIRLFHDREIDGIVIGTMTFGDELPALTIAERMNGLPVLLFGTREAEFTDDGKRRSDSFCGTISIASGLNRRGLPFSFLGICFPEEETFSVGISSFIRTCNSIKGFRYARIGQVGPRPERFETCSINESPMILQFGQKVVPISLADLFHRADNLNPTDGIESITDEIKSTSNCKHVSAKTLNKLARLEIILKRYVSERNLSVLALRCGTEMEEIYGVSACTVLGRLTEQGIMTSCEADINGVLTMLLQYLASLQTTPPFLFDWTIQHQTEDNLFLAWHCGNAPMSLRAMTSEVMIKDHSLLSPILGCEKCEGTAEFQLKPGIVTLNSLAQYNGKFSLLVTTGEVIPSEDSLRGSWCWVKVKNLERLYRTIIEHGFSHHASLIYGDFKKPLDELCRFVGIEAVVV